MKYAITAQSGPLAHARRTPLRGAGNRLVQERRRPCVACRATADTTQQPRPTPGPTPNAGEDEREGLLPEEDQEIPGGWMDAMTPSTKLGKAVKAATEELEHLGRLELEVLSEADKLLQQLGVKGSIFGKSGQVPAPAPLGVEDKQE